MTDYIGKGRSEGGLSMKIYISADIEGVCGIADWDEAIHGKVDYEPFRIQMTDEIRAACEGALKANANEIWVKDAHDRARNIIDIKQLPPNVRLIRGWSRHPFMMMQELDETFDAVIMIGYHSFAGSKESPLAHTLDPELIDFVKINDHNASEFLINAYTAAYVNVPVVLVSGDRGLCQHVEQFNKNISTIETNQGVGQSIISKHPDVVVKQIKEKTAEVLQGDIGKCRITLPEIFKVEISYRHHYQAYKSSFYPGMKEIAPTKVIFETDNYFDVLRMMLFVC